MLMMVVGLTVNVVAPANASSSSKLPVVVVCTLWFGILFLVLIMIHLVVDIWR